MTAIARAGTWSLGWVTLPVLDAAPHGGSVKPATFHTENDDGTEAT